MKKCVLDANLCLQKMLASRLVKSCRFRRSCRQALQFQGTCATAHLPSHRQQNPMKLPCFCHAKLGFLALHPQIVWGTVLWSTNYTKSPLPKKQIWLDMSALGPINSSCWPVSLEIKTNSANPATIHYKYRILSFADRTNRSVKRRNLRVKSK